MGKRADKSVTIRLDFHPHLTPPDPDLPGLKLFGRNPSVVRKRNPIPSQGQWIDVDM